MRPWRGSKFEVCKLLLRDSGCKTGASLCSFISFENHLTGGIENLGVVSIYRLERTFEKILSEFDLIWFDFLFSLTEKSKMLSTKFEIFRKCNRSLLQKKKRTIWTNWISLAGKVAIQVSITWCLSFVSKSINLTKTRERGERKQICNSVPITTKESNKIQPIFSTFRIPLHH